jgi:hypothetical protein
MPPIRFETLIPIDGSPEEQAAATDDLCELYSNAQAAGMDPVAGIETTPDGDVLSFEVDDE